MRRSLFVKFILAYLAFGILGFIVVASISSRMTYTYLMGEQANNLYSEATLISTTYSDSSNAAMSEEIINEQMKAVSAFLHVDIWLVDRNGKVISDSNQESRKGAQITDFDPAKTGNQRYLTGTYHNMFDYEVLTVAAPITRNWNRSFCA